MESGPGAAQRPDQIPCDERGELWRVRCRRGGAEAASWQSALQRLGPRPVGRALVTAIQVCNGG
eukprot:4704698-Lingulodinium_polyedra.AAC.1